ncbi:GTPase [Chromatium okenii]|uniref:GTPase n=1 Tax=Chromatium okenii TaxID=61644 RepID=UPI0015594255|nr:GTPase [Chromatium okenii]
MLRLLATWWCSRLGAYGTKTERVNLGNNMQDVLAETMNIFSEAAHKTVDTAFAEMDNNFLKPIEQQAQTVNAALDHFVNILEKEVYPPMKTAINTVQEILHEGEPILSTYLDAAMIKIVTDDVQKKAIDATPVVMVFGVYNAGKSTLLNAMLGEERASMADKPETDK